MSNDYAVVMMVSVDRYHCVQLVRISTHVKMLVDNNNNYISINDQLYCSLIVEKYLLKLNFVMEWLCAVCARVMKIVPGHGRKGTWL